MSTAGRQSPFFAIRQRAAERRLQRCTVSVPPPKDGAIATLPLSTKRVPRWELAEVSITRAFASTSSGRPEPVTVPPSSTSTRNSVPTLTGCWNDQFAAPPSSVRDETAPPLPVTGFAAVRRSTVPFGSGSESSVVAMPVSVALAPE